MPPTRSWNHFADAAGHAVFRCRDVLAPVVILVLVATSRRGDFIAPPSFDRWLDAAGVSAVAVGLAIRFLVIAGSGIRKSGVHKRIVAPALYDTGPYAWCRNPLYLANGIILIGLALLFDSRWMACTALPAALLAIRSIVSAEERLLAEQFGDRYHRYCRRVPRFLPQRPFALVSGRPLDWRRAIRKEHGTIFAAATTALVLLAAEDLARVGLAEWSRRVPASLTIWLVVASLWSAVRLLKRRGRLRDRPSPLPVRAPGSEVPVGDVAA